MLINLDEASCASTFGWATATFQQLQKYEKGANRVGVSRLQKISKKAVALLLRTRRIWRSRVSMNALYSPAANQLRTPWRRRTNQLQKNAPPAEAGTRRANYDSRFSVRRAELVDIYGCKMSSHETRDLGEISGHRIAGDLDARRVEPSVCIERLFCSSGGTEM